MLLEGVKGFGEVGLDPVDSTVERADAGGQTAEAVFGLEMSRYRIQVVTTRGSWGIEMGNRQQDGSR